MKKDNRYVCKKCGTFSGTNSYPCEQCGGTEYDYCNPALNRGQDFEYISFGRIAFAVFAWIVAMLGFSGLLFLAAEKIGVIALSLLVFIISIDCIKKVNTDQLKGIFWSYVVGLAIGSGLTAVGFILMCIR